MSRLTWREAVRIHEERARADRQATPPEDASGMRCLGCGYYDDEPQAQRMCEAGEGTGHAFVRVGPDGCVPAPDDDPATLRARLEKRYERPERPCTYDPDGDPLWFERARAQLEAPPVEPVLVMSPANAERFNRELAAACAMPERYDPADEEPEGDWTPPRPEPLEYPAVAPQGGPDPRNDVRGLTKKRFSESPEWHNVPAPPSWDRTVREASARADEIRRHPLTGTSTWDTLTLPPGGDASDMFADGTPHTCPVVEPPGWSDGAEVTTYPCPVCGDMFDACDCDQSAAHLRSYLRTLTNPDAPAEDVAAALDLLTDEDRELVAALIKRNP